MKTQPQDSMSNTTPTASKQDRLRAEMGAAESELGWIRQLAPPRRESDRKALAAAVQDAERQLEALHRQAPIADDKQVQSHRKSLRKTRKALMELSQKILLLQITKGRIPKKGIFVGIDLGGTNAQVVVVTGAGAMVASQKVVVAAVGDAQAVIDLIARQTRSLLGEAGYAWNQVLGIGVGTAGTIDFTRGLVVLAPNLKWHDVPVESLLRDKLSVPIFLDNDVNIGTLGEWALGAGRGYNTVVGIFWGTGIGGGLIVNGELFRGANGMAAEVGHMVVQPGGPRCGCGNRGCMEAIAGRGSITREIRVAIRQGEPTVMSALVGHSPRLIRSGVLREAVQQKDRLTMNVLQRAAEAVGMGIAHIANMIDPDAFIIGGGVVEALGDWIVDRAAHAALKNIICADRRTFTVRRALLGDNGGALGGAILAMQRWSEKQSG